MLDPEDMDLSKALSRLSKLAVRLSENIAVELADEQRALAIVDVLRDTANLISVRLLSAPPTVIDAGPDELSPDQRLGAGLALMAYQISLAAQELHQGLLEQSERDDLADAMSRLARDLWRGQPKRPGDPESERGTDLSAR